MCEPTTAVTIGSAVVSTGLGIAQNALGYSAQEDAYEQNKKSAEESAMAQIQAIKQQQQQMAQASSRSTFMADLEARRAAAVTSVSAGESGVAGSSVDMILADIERQRLQFKTDEQANLKNASQQAAMEAQGVEAQKRGRINAVPRGSATGAILGSVGSVASGTATVMNKWPKIG